VASGKPRLRLHQQAGREFSPASNYKLVNKAKEILERELQGYRGVSILSDGRLYINPKANPIEESKSQQILSLLLGAQAETEALRGRSMRPNAPVTQTELEDRAVLEEVVGRGLISPEVLSKFAARGFRDPSKVSTDDLSQKFYDDVFQIGSGYEPGTGAAYTSQHKQSGHLLDDNLYPELGHSIDNIEQQSKIVNQVTADSAKGRSVINPKYKSIIDQRKAALKMINDQYKKDYKDTVYNDDGDSDIYGSALDELISEIRMADPEVLAGYNKLKANAGARSDSPGTSRERVLNIRAGGDVSIGEGVLRSNGKNGNGNGKH
jgi:hypothetical protein